MLNLGTEFSSLMEMPTSLDPKKYLNAVDDGVAGDAWNNVDLVEGISLLSQ